MSEVLKRVEDYNGMEVDRTDHQRIGYLKKVLNTEFVDVFMDAVGNSHKLQEFVFAVDLLIDISKSRSFPFLTGRLLNNVDVTQKAVFTLNNLARVARDRSLFGCQVSPDTEELINEFFEYNYLQLFGEFFSKTRFPFATFELDNVWYSLILSRELGPVREFAAIKLIRANGGNEVYIPFLKSRLEG